MEWVLMAAHRAPGRIVHPSCRWIALAALLSTHAAHAARVEFDVELPIRPRDPGVIDGIGAALRVGGAQLAVGTFGYWALPESKHPYHRLTAEMQAIGASQDLTITATRVNWAAGILADWGLVPRPLHDPAASAPRPGGLHVLCGLSYAQSTEVIGTLAPTEHDGEHWDGRTEWTWSEPRSMSARVAPVIGAAVDVHLGATAGLRFEMRDRIASETVPGLRVSSTGPRRIQHVVSFSPALAVVF